MAEPPTLFDFVRMRSGPTTVTESDGELFVSVLSTITFAGSTVAVPPPRGLLNVPGVDGVAVKTTSNVDAAASVTDPEATQARSDVPLIVHVMVPVTPVALAIEAAPYVTPAFGRLSDRIVCPELSVTGSPLL